LALAVMSMLVMGCGEGEGGGADAPTVSTVANKANGNGVGIPALQAVMQERELTPDDVVAAAKTYMPTGKHDEALIFASGGHSGQLFVIGVPSMRLLRTIAVFTPEPWQGWGYGVGNDVLAEGSGEGRELTWADTHHPALSETGGNYDGQWCFINDKANARVAVIDLRDFETKQIVKNPVSMSDHGGAFVTPDTEYVIEGGQYAQPLGWEYAPMEQYEDKYRGMVTLWKFDRDRGRLDPDQSFALELPPYWQDLMDAGKNASEGWLFGNSINTELAVGTLKEGDQPFEAGASQRDMDYLHVIHMAKVIELYKAGKYEEVNGFPVIRLQTLIDEGVLFFIGEPKSPHGVDITPDGQFIVISGKLDPHVTIYGFENIQKAIADKNYTSKDQYGVPVLDFDACKVAQVEVGLGPLHTQFDEKGYAYTSLFLEPAVARWTLGGDYDELNAEPAWSLVGKTSVHYNIGHLLTMEGDTVSPKGKYLVAMNKWSIDRFFPTGPLLPQNFQLIDISEPGETMPLLYDMPIGVGEPHYAQMILADKLKPWKVYPEVGWNPHVQAVDPSNTKTGEERIERKDGEVHIYMTVIRSHFAPEHIEVNEGETVVWHLTSQERAQDATHGLAIPAYNINLSIEPSEYTRVRFVADQPGTFPFYCSEFCSALHLEMMGYLRVKPTAVAQSD
jgi:nitrous-oxide reductase